MRVKLIFGLLALFLVTTLTACSSESHEEKMAREEQEKQERAELAASAVKGVGNALSGVGSDAAESLSHGVTDVISGLGRGVEKGTEFPVSVHENLAGQGVNATLATRNMSSPDVNAVSVYVTFEQDGEAVLQLRAYDKDEREIGRSNKIPALMEADEAEYLHFSFDGQTPLTRVEKMVLYASKASAPAAEADTRPQDPEEPDAF